MASRILLACALLCLGAISAFGQTATYLGDDRLTQGAWKGTYCTVGCNLYSSGLRADPTRWAKGVGSQYRGGGVRFDPQLPQRVDTHNCCDPVTYVDTRPGHLGTFTVKTGDPWPPDARIWSGLYHRSDLPGQRMRVGIVVPVPQLVSTYVVDYDRASRRQLIEVYADSGIVDNEPGSVGISHANGPLLASVIVEHFEAGVYVRFAAQGNLILQYTALGTTPPNADGMAVESGIFVDPLPQDAPAPIPAPNTFTTGPLTILADHVGVVSGYRCYVDGVKVADGAPITGGFQCAVAGLTIGLHTVHTSAWNAVGETASAAVTVTIVAPPPVEPPPPPPPLPPPPPSRLRITIDGATCVGSGNVLTCTVTP